VNVNNNVTKYPTAKKLETSSGTAKKAEFKKVLNNYELSSKKPSNKNADKMDNKDSDKVTNESNSETSQNQEIQNKDIQNKTNKVDDSKNEDSENNDETLEESKTKNDLSDSSYSADVITELISLIKIPEDMIKQNTEKLPEDVVDDSNIEIKTEIINFIDKSMDVIKKDTEKPSDESIINDKATDETTQMQQLLQILGSMFQANDSTSAVKTSKTEVNSINLEGLIGVEKLTADTKGILKDNLSEMVSLLEKPEGNKKISAAILDIIKNVTSEVEAVKGNISLLKVITNQNNSLDSEGQLIKDNMILLNKVMDQSTKISSEKTTSLNISNENQAQIQTQAQSSNNTDGGNKSSENSSSEEKFLKSLLGENKDDMKISKAVSFMNQFESIKTGDTVKVQAPNLVINKSSLEVDIIKSVKFMEINNIKDLVVKMNPKELGEITIKLTVESGIMKANISAQNKETFNLLNQNMQEISDRLKNMDIKIQSLDINIYEDSTFFAKDSSDRNNNESQNNKAGTNIDLDEEDIPLSNNYVIEENEVNEFV